CGTVCSATQKQTPGGGILMGATLSENKITYAAAQGFAGEYEITVRRNWGQPLGGRARLEIVQNVGTSKETRRIETVHLDRASPIKLNLANGRRTEMASVPPPAATQTQEAKEARLLSAGNVLGKLRAIASPDFTAGSGFRGGASTPGASTPNI